MRWIGWARVGASAGGLADAVEALGETAFVDEGGGQRGNLTVEQRARHADQYVGRVGGKFGIRGCSVLLGNPRGHGIGGGAATGDESLTPGIVAVPQPQPALPEEVLVVEAQFLEAGAGDAGEFELGFLDVPLAALPSAMFCTPLRAAWTIWSWVRLRFEMQRSQNRTVTSKESCASWKLFKWR